METLTPILLIILLIMLVVLAFLLNVVADLKESVKTLTRKSIDLEYEQNSLKARINIREEYLDQFIEEILKVSRKLLENNRDALEAIIKLK